MKLFPTLRVLLLGLFFGPGSASAQLSLQSAGMHTVWKEAPAPVLTIPQAQQSPTIDGRTEEAAWQHAALADCFIEVSSAPRQALWGIEPATAQTAVRLLYDDQHLYLAWRCEEPRMDTLKAEAEQRDGPVREDDSVRFILELSRGGLPVRVIDVAVNAANVIFDAHTREGHAQWQLEGLRSAVHRAEDGWQVEMAIPFAGLGVDRPVPGETWWVNFGRERHAGGGSNRETSYWAGQPQSVFDTHSYKGQAREIRFGESVALVASDIPRPFIGSGEVTATLANDSDQPRRLTGRLTLAPHGDLTEQIDIDLPPNETTSIRIPFTIDTEGVQILYLIVEEDDAVHAAVRRPFYVAPVSTFLTDALEQLEQKLEEAEEGWELRESISGQLPRMREIQQHADAFKERRSVQPISQEAEQEWQTLAEQAMTVYGETGWFNPPALYLTWQRDPATTMTIQWHSHDPLRHNMLQYQLVEGDEGAAWHTRLGWSQPAPHSDRSVHMVELAGLEPDTDYRFRFGPGLEIYQFRTMPQNADEPVVFISGGDTLHRREWFEQMNRQASKHEPRFAVLGGDIAYGDGKPERVDRWYEFFDVWTSTMITPQGRRVPLVMAIGNHEVAGGYVEFGGSVERAPFFYGFFAMPGLGGYNALDFGDYMSLILLDTGHTTRIKGQQTRWLERVLAKRQNVPHVFPVLHVPAYPAHFPFQDRWANRIREHWAPLFEKYGVQVVFENHDHVYKRTHPIRAGEVDPEGVVYLGGGAWGVTILREHPVDETPYLAAAKSVRHVYVVTVHRDGRRFTVLDIDGNAFEKFSIDRGQAPVMAKPASE